MNSTFFLINSILFFVGWVYYLEYYKIEEVTFKAKKGKIKGLYILGREIVVI